MNAVDTRQKTVWKCMTSRVGSCLASTEQKGWVLFLNIAVIRFFRVNQNFQPREKCIDYAWLVLEPASFPLQTSMFIYSSVGRLISRSVCHNFRKGRKVTLPCSYRSTCFSLDNVVFYQLLSRILNYLNYSGVANLILIYSEMTNQSPEQVEEYLKTNNINKVSFDWSLER